MMTSATVVQVSYTELKNGVRSPKFIQGSIWYGASLDKTINCIAFTNYKTTMDRENTRD